MLVGQGMRKAREGQDGSDGGETHSDWIKRDASRSWVLRNLDLDLLEMSGLVLLLTFEGSRAGIYTLLLPNRAPRFSHLSRTFLPSGSPILRLIRHGQRDSFRSPVSFKLQASIHGLAPEEGQTTSAGHDIKTEDESSPRIQLGLACQHRISTAEKRRN